MFSSSTKRKFILALVLSVLLLWYGQSVWAAQQSRSIYQTLDTPLYDSNDRSCAVAGGLTADDSGGATPDGPLYQSGLNPPYIMEQFAIHTLKAIAQKKGIPETDTVTHEHVVAVIAFMFGEGGDINNQDLFNPLNTGLNAPELLATDNAANGVQSFKSFDAGVEATARTMLGSNQSRLAGTLSKPESTAKQFMYALSYYDKYPGNAFWAAASQPPNQDDYYHQRLSLVNQVRGSYKDIASIVIGTSAKEQIENIHQPNLLQFQDGGGAAGDDPIDASGCEGAQTNGPAKDNIVQTAVNFSWPNHDHPDTAKPTYAAAINKYNPGASCNGADCGVFVATVMRASEADPDYPLAGTGQQESYVRSSDKYQVVDPATNDMQPGDILIVNSGSGEGVSGHTYIFVGNQTGGYNAAGASLCTGASGGHMPWLTNAEIVDPLGRGNYIIARLK